MNELEAIKTILNEQHEMLKQITDKALTYIDDTTNKALFLNDCERIAINSQDKMLRLQKEFRGKNDTKK